MPIFLAVLAIFLGPISHASRANTVLTEACVALEASSVRRPEPSLLETTHGFGLVGMIAGDDESIL